MKVPVCIARTMSRFLCCPPRLSKWQLLIRQTLLCYSLHPNPLRHYFNEWQRVNFRSSQGSRGKQECAPTLKNTQTQHGHVDYDNWHYQAAQCSALWVPGGEGKWLEDCEWKERRMIHGYQSLCSNQDVYSQTQNFLMDPHFFIRCDKCSNSINNGSQENGTLFQWRHLFLNKLEVSI